MADVYLGVKTMTYKNPNYHKEYYAAHKEENKERDKKAKRKYYLEHQEEIKEGMKEQHKTYYAEHREEVKIKVKEYYSKNKEKIKNKRRVNHPFKQKIIRTEEEERSFRKNQSLKKNFGITLEEYNQMKFEQDCCCFICGRHEDEFPLHQLFVDHDHNKGKVRKLLCNNCNSILGHARDDINVLYKAIAYLKLFR